MPPAARVLYVVPGRPEGHNMVFARDAARALRQQGIVVDEFYLQSRTHPVTVLREMVRLRREIRRTDADVLHAQYGGVTGLVTVMAAGRRPTVLSVRGSDLNRVPTIHPVRGWLTRSMTQLAALRARAVVCVSPALAAQLWTSRRTVVIPSGVDTSIFCPTDRNAARRDLGWPIDEAVVLFNAGKAPEQKGLPLVEQAFEALSRRGVAARLHVVQGGATRGDMARLMAASDCVVLASLTEGSPNVVKEAMACNLPVVAVPVGDVALRLAHVTPGAIVERNSDSLADALADVLRAPSRSNGRDQLARQGLSIDHTTKTLLGLYFKVLRRHGADRRCESS